MVNVDPLLVVVGLSALIMVTYTPAERYLPKPKVAVDEVDPKRWRTGTRDGNRRVVEDSFANEWKALLIS